MQQEVHWSNVTPLPLAKSITAIIINYVFYSQFFFNHQTCIVTIFDSLTFYVDVYHKL